MVKAKEFQKNIYVCFFDYAKAFDCVDHNKQWKILKEMGLPDHVTSLLRNLYAVMDVKLSKPQKMGKDKEGWRAAIHGVTKSWT